MEKETNTAVTLPRRVELNAGTGNRSHTNGLAKMIHKETTS